MKSLSVFLFFLIIFTGAAMPGLAEAFDPSGNYQYILSDSSISGPCPMGQDGRGTLTIQKSGAGYTIKYLKGMTCNPASVCILSGSCQGKVCSFSRTVKVDNEGGTVTNSADFTFDKNHANGKGSSVYKHPGGMQCTWTYLLMLTK